jgi:hypothetical protein
MLHATVSSQGPTRGKSPISVPFVIGAALLMGLGIFAMAIWLVTMDWLWFAGVVPATVGALMMFDRRAGAESAA